MMKKITLSLFTICLFLQACNMGTPTQANAYVRFMEDEQSYQSEVSFSDSEGKVKSLEDVFFIDGAMEKRNIPSKGIVYKAEKDGAFVSPMLIKAKNEKGELVSFEVNMIPIGNLGIKEPQLSRTNGFTVTWQGAFAADEELVALVTDEEGTSESVNIKVAKDETDHFVEPGQIKALANGKGTIAFIKIRNYNVEGEHCNAKVLAEYYTKPVNILIGE
jgi:hypothetical protein